MQVKFLKIGSIVIFFLAIVFFIFAGIFTDFIQVFSSSYGEFGKYDGISIGYKNADFNSIVSRVQQSQDQNVSEQQVLYQAYNYALAEINATQKSKKAGFVPSKAVINKGLNELTKDGMIFSPAVYESFYAKKSAAEAEKNRISDLNTLYTETYNLLMAFRYVRDVFGISNQFQYQALLIKLNGARSACGYSYADIVQGGVFQEVSKNADKLTYGTKTSPKEDEFLAKFATEKHSYDLASFELSKYPASETKKFIENNKDLFAKMDLSVITYENKSDAKAALKSLKAEEKTFEEAFLASELRYYSLGQGKSALSYKYQLKEILSDSDLNAVCSLKNGEYSDVVKTGDEYSFFFCNGDTTEADVNNEELVTIAKNYITSSESELVTDYFKSEAEKLIEKAKTAGFDAACKEFNADKVAVPAFPINYGDSFAADTAPSSVYQLARVSKDESVLKTLFSLKTVGDVSAPISYGNNVIVAKLTGIQNDAKNEKVNNAVSYFDFYSPYMNIANGKNVTSRFDEAFAETHNR